MGLLRRLFGGPNRGEGFLAALTPAQRIKVSNLNPLIYEAIAAEKRGQQTATVVMVGGGEEVLGLLRQLEVADLERLAESVRMSMQGDQASSRDMEQAAQHYKRAAEINPYNDLALMSYGVALAKLGRLREGIQWVERAIKVNPGNQRARENLRLMKADL
jgi:tetratricopeptide (TPR) repeat protein